MTEQPTIIKELTRRQKQDFIDHMERNTYDTQEQWSIWARIVLKVKISPHACMELFVDGLGSEGNNIL